MSYVYFAVGFTGPRAGLIKIGVSENPTRRQYNAKGRLLACQSGTVEDEKRLHERFAADRVSGEWFNPSRELLAYIGQILEDRSTDELLLSEILGGRQ